MTKLEIAKMIRKLKAKIKELEQQLAEQVAYGERLKYYFGLALEYACDEYAISEDTFNMLDKHLNQQPSPALVNKMKAEAVREYGEHLSHAEDRLTPEEYAKQLEGGE